MSYVVGLPNGRSIEFPDTVSRDEAARIIQRQFPELASKERTFGEAFSDIGAAGFC